MDEEEEMVVCGMVVILVVGSIYGTIYGLGEKFFCFLKNSLMIQ